MTQPIATLGEIARIPCTPYILLIKGNPGHARNAAEEHNITIRSIARIQGAFETLVRADVANEASLSAWMAEHVNTPLPAGSLLFYAPRTSISDIPEEF